MPAIHRQDDSRACGATTIVTGQSTVYAGGKLVSVNGDENTDGGGALTAACNNVFAGGMLVVNVGDSAAPDSLCPIPGGPHCAPDATGGLGTVIVGD